MSVNLIFYSRYNINCNTIISQFIKGNKHIRYGNNYLIPFHCQNINTDNCVLKGNFIYPIWNTLERTILSSNNTFPYTYLSGDKFTIEIKNNALKSYNLISGNRLYSNSLKISDSYLKQNALLLFPIHVAIAAPLIDYKLI
jgi:hypothetical protein